MVRADAWAAARRAQAARALDSQAAAAAKAARRQAVRRNGNDIEPNPGHSLLLQSRSGAPRSGVPDATAANKNASATQHYAVVTSTDVSTADGYERAMDFIIDAHLIGECDGFVGKFSSSLGRIGYSLMATRGGVDCLRPFHSLDVPWCFGLACRKEGNERLKTVWKRREKMLRRAARDRTIKKRPASPTQTVESLVLPPPPPPPHSEAATSSSSADQTWRGQSHAAARDLARQVRMWAG